MCLTSDAVYRIRDADAIFRIERKDDQKIAQNSKLFYRKYFEFATNHSGSVRGTLWRIVLKYIIFVCAWFSHFTVGTCRTRRITLRVPRKIMTDHDMRPIRLNTKRTSRKLIGEKSHQKFGGHGPRAPPPLDTPLCLRQHINKLFCQGHCHINLHLFESTTYKNTYYMQSKLHHYQKFKPNSD